MLHETRINFRRRIVNQTRRFSCRAAAQFNKSPEPTAVGACSSAVAVHVASRRWLSFLRWASLRAFPKTKLSPVTTTGG